MSSRAACWRWPGPFGPIGRRDPAGQPPGQVDAGDRAARVAGEEAAPARVPAVGDDVLIAYEDQAARAAALGWPVTRLASHHLALLTDPPG
jgi:hypothetical protein